MPITCPAGPTARAIALAAEEAERAQRGFVEQIVQQGKAPLLFGRRSVDVSGMSLVGHDAGLAGMAARCGCS
jgi:hypothetical protein